MKLENKAG